MSPVTRIPGQMPWLRSIAELISGMVILFQHEDDDLIEATVIRREGPVVIRVVNPSDPQAFAQLKCECRHQILGRLGSREASHKRFDARN